MNAKIFFLIFVLTFSLALAVVDVDVDRLPPDYSQGEIVEITLICPAPTAQRSTVEIFNPEGRLIYITGGNDQWTTTYNTGSDSSDGQYKLLARCTDGSTAEDFFCVDAPGCTSTGSGGGGGSGRCSSNITCSTFSYCNATLQQTRSCHDWNNCRIDYTEEIACAACLEAWSCSEWSTCQGNRQRRTCLDDHLCGTLLQKPSEQQICTVHVVAPTRITPPSTRPPVVVQPSFFSQYKWWLLGGLLLLLLIIGAILFYYLYYKMDGEKKVFNLNELKNWIRKEKAAGTSDEDIKQILAQQTGWKDKEISEAFRELHHPQLGKEQAQLSQRRSPSFSR